MKAPVRRPILAANWKMHMTRPEGGAFVEDLLARSLSPGVEVVLCPPFTLLHTLAVRLQGTSLQLGAQNMYYEKAGAFTGEISPGMLRDAGVRYVILGHSERRAVFGETDDLVGRKVAAALDAGLLPILCVGETLKEREAGKTLAVVEGQLAGGLQGVSREAAGTLVIAYEPVWAIGTGRAATGEDAREVAAFLRRSYRDRFGAAAAEALRVQYGGSVKGENIEEFTRYPEIDGALVGGASLQAGSWHAIVQTVGRQLSAP